MGNIEHKGRKKGTPNKDTSHIIDLCTKLKCDPVEILAHIANGDWKSLGYKSPTERRVGLGGYMVDQNIIELDHRMDAAKKLMDFIYPKRKSVEIKTENDGNAPFVLAYNPASFKEKKDDKN